jgi:magnesium transporter
MARRIKKRSKKAGMPPGVLVHIGEQLAAATKITILDYDECRTEERTVSIDELTPPPRERAGVMWIHVDGIHDVEVLEILGRKFGIHPLVIEDILNTDQRPKIEDNGDYLYIVLKKLYQEAEHPDELLPEQVSIILGPNFLISFKEREGTLFSPLRERIKSCQGRISKEGPDYLAYALIDSIVDGYFIFLESLGEKIETAEDDLVTNPSRQTLHVIQTLKREMIFFRKFIWPLREIINYLEHTESSLISDSMGIYFRDVYDHTIQVMDTVETYRDMLSSMLDIYLSSISNKMNEIMKVLTIIATIFMPLTFLAGVYGMNFKHFPEIEWTYGYLFFWLFCISIALSMIHYFRKKKWM